MTSILDSTLEILHAAYTADRAECARAATSIADTPRNTCGYCGRFWRPFGGSKLAGHATCVVSEAFQRQVEFRYRTDPRLTMVAIARKLDVSVATVVAWVRSVERGRRAA